MADQVMTAGSHLSAIVPEVWSSRYYDVLLASLPFNDSISRDYEGEITDLGDTVNIISFPEFAAAGDNAEDGVVEADAITLTSQQLVVNKMITKDFIVTKKALIQSLPHMDKLRELAIYSVMKKVQTIIIDAIVASSSSPDHQIAYDAGTTLALADILEVKELLDLQDVPAGDRSGVLGAAQVNDIFAIAGFTSSDFLTAGSGAPLATGQIPPLVGFNIRSTTEVGNNSYWFHKSFMTIAAQKGLDIAEYDLGGEGKRAARVNVTHYFGLKQLDNTRVVELS